MQWIAVLLSEMLLMCLWLVFKNDFGANKIAFSSRTLTMISFSTTIFVAKYLVTIFLLH